MTNERIKAKNITLGQLLDVWVEEELKMGSMSNGTVELYQNIVKVMKRHPICNRKLTTITSEHLQIFMDQISFGGKAGDFDSREGYAKEYAKKPHAVLNHAFRFAVFPKKYITGNPMQYVVIHKRNDDADIFGNDDELSGNIKPLTDDMYKELLGYLEEHHPDAVLPVQIAYYSGLRIGEVSGLMWHDININEHYMTIRRSVTYDSIRRRLEIGTTKRAKVRIVEFGDTLADILADAKQQQIRNEQKYGNHYHDCYYKKVLEKSRIYYDYHDAERTETLPGEYHAIDFVCRRESGILMRPSTIKSVCWYVSKKVPGFENFHFHVLRHTYTTNLLAKGAKPKDVQELLGHSAMSTTMDIYAHATRESKRATVRLLDQLYKQ